MTKSRRQSQDARIPRNAACSSLFTMAIYSTLGRSDSAKLYSFPCRLYAILRGTLFAQGTTVFLKKKKKNCQKIQRICHFKVHQSIYLLKFDLHNNYHKKKPFIVQNRHLKTYRFHLPRLYAVGVVPSIISEFLVALKTRSREKARIKKN